MRKKIVTLNFIIAANTAANTAHLFERKLDITNEWKKCRGFGIALSSTGGAGVHVDASLEPIKGRPLIDPVHVDFLRVDPSSVPDSRLHTIDFDVTSDSVQVVISPKALTTAAITGQAIFLLTDE